MQSHQSSHLDSRTAKPKQDLGGAKGRVGRGWTNYRARDLEGGLSTSLQIHLYWGRERCDILFHGGRIHSLRVCT